MVPTSDFKIPAVTSLYIPWPAVAGAGSVSALPPLGSPVPPPCNAEKQAVLVVDGEYTALSTAPPCNAEKQAVSVVDGEYTALSTL